MASDRATLAYRPDEEERALLTTLAKRYGVSMSRMIGISVRRMAVSEGITVGAGESAKTSGDSEKVAVTA